MTVLSLACSRAGRAHDCHHPACECPCHHIAPRMQPTAALDRVLTWERVRGSVEKLFADPTLVNTQGAIETLQEYEQLLKEARRGR